MGNPIYHSDSEDETVAPTNSPTPAPDKVAVAAHFQIIYNARRLMADLRGNHVDIIVSRHEAFINYMNMLETIDMSPFNDDGDFIDYPNVLMQRVDREFGIGEM
jgi:hypothetical protein